MKKTKHSGLVERARFLAWFTVLYNLVEAVLSVAFGAKDGSLALTGFGADSLIEAAAAGVVLWRFSFVLKNKDDARERAAQKWIAVLLMALALFLFISAWFEFKSQHRPTSGVAGVVISVLSLAVMAWLYRAKMACATGLKSRALRADAFCTLSCMWLSGLLLAGSALFAGTQLAWFDALTTAGMAFLIAREGMEEYEDAE